MSAEGGEQMSRADAARHRIELAQSTERAESAAAQARIDAFVTQAKAAGLPPVPLRATTYDGKGVKTDKTGWYIRKNRSIAIGEDGGYYVLTVGSSGVLDRLRGVKLTPTPPPLVVGRGGRDGESGDLQDFLDRALRGEV